jgi:hypothetical protein
MAWHEGSPVPSLLPFWQKIKLIVDDKFNYLINTIYQTLFHVYKLKLF